MIPGFIDTHVHALGVAEAEATQPFVNLRSIGELQAWIRAEVERRPLGTWIWTPRVFPTRLREHRFPTRAGARRRGAAVTRSSSTAPTRSRSTAPRFERRASGAARPIRLAAPS